MDTLSIYDFLGLFEFLNGYPAAFIVIITSGLILVLRDWRWLLLALLVQYLVVGFLFADVTVAHLAFIKVLVGTFICLILYVTAVQVNWGQLPEDITEEELVQIRLLTDVRQEVDRISPYALADSTPVRLLMAFLVVLAAWLLSSQLDFQILDLPDYLTMAILVLIGIGLLSFSLSSEPMKAGLGLMTFLIGFDLFYSSVDQSEAMILMWATADLFIVLAIAYLIQARHTWDVLVD